MDAILRATLVYFFLLILFRVSGKRTLNTITTFDLVLLLILSECVQNALTGEDHSMTHSFLLVVTFIALDIGLSLIKQQSNTIETFLEGQPLVLLEHGIPIGLNLAKSRIDVDDILESARETQGLMRLDQIKYAILERDGKISIIPADAGK